MRESSGHEDSNNGAKSSRAESAESIPHPEWTFGLRTRRSWVVCPDCHSDSVDVRVAEQPSEDAAGWASDQVLWLECLSCGNTTATRRGLPVEQPQPAEAQEESKSFLRRLIS